MEVNIKIGLK